MLLHLLRSALVLTLPLLSCVSAQEGGHAAPKVRRAPEDLSPEELRATRVYREALPSVVSILTMQSTPEGLVRGLGAGVLISPDCHILTAAHVVDGALAIQVKPQDGTLRAASIVFSEPDADFALLRLDEPDATLPHAELGDSDRLAIGQEAYVIGNPRGLENSFSIGHISAFREFHQLYDGTILAEFLQTDAAINSGNSGGPVLDSHGRVIGITSRILTQSGGSEGLGLAVTINTAKALLAMPERAWTGLDGVFLSGEDTAALLQTSGTSGLLVQRVAKGSPADRAGLRGGRYPVRFGDRTLLLGGDLILSLGDQAACHAACLAHAHDRLVNREQIPVTYLRAGEVHQALLDVSASHRAFLKSDS